MTSNTRPTNCSESIHGNNNESAALPEREHGLVHHLEEEASALSARKRRHLPKSWPEIKEDWE